MKVKRVTFYFVNHDNLDDDSVADLLEQSCGDCMSPRNIEIAEVDVGEWDDEHRCNQCDYDLAQEFK